ncbi:hypothetical protein [Streptomyces sp.]|uniref:hypothetical protein n=1 Tax=Streptomyces sp. TaxID=1931 RepID=UPI002F959D96
MNAIFPDMRKRPPSSKTEAARMFRASRPTGRNDFIMTQTYAEPLTQEECAAIDAFVEGWFRQALHLVRSAHGTSMAAAPPFTEMLSGLDVYTPQAVS